MPHQLTIPPALHHLFKSVTLREDGSVIIEYLRPVPLVALDYDATTCILRAGQAAETVTLRAAWAGPANLCATCGKPRVPHEYRHIFKEPA